MASGRIPDSAMVEAGWVLLFAATVVRFSIYVYGYSSPLRLSRRLGTGRIIIPGYDVIFLPLIGAVFVFAAVASGLGLTEISAFLPGTLALFFSLLTLLYVGPSLETWQLTDHHRLSPGGVGNDLYKPI